MGTIEFNFWSFLLIIGVGQGAILYLVLQFKKPSRPALVILALLLLILTLNLFEFLLMSSSYYEIVPHLMQVTHPFLFLLGPLFYFFVKAQFNREFRLKDIHWAHAILFAAAVLYFLPWFTKPAEFKLDAYHQILSTQNSGVGLGGFIYAFAHISQTIIYSLFALKEIRAFKNEQNGLTEKGGQQLRFIDRFGRTFLVYWMLQMVGLVTIMIVQYYVHYIDYTLALINSFFIQLLSYHFLIQPDRLAELSISRKYEGSALSSQSYRTLLKRIEELMVQDEVFLDSELTLQKFSTRLEVNKNYVSQVINEEYGYGFTEYINNHRIERAKKMMKDPEYDWMKLLAIALETGFNNKTSFNRVFTKKTGLNPSQYRRQFARVEE